MSENSNFICLTRSLIEKAAWVDARPTHQTVFMHILLRCAFKEIEHNIQGNIIKILPGQLCATIRQIQDWSGKWISKNDVEGSIRYFQKVNFLRQEVRHGKTLLTIIDSDIYNCLIRSNQTTSQTEVRQKSDIKEEREEREEREKEHISPSTSSSGNEIFSLNAQKAIPAKETKESGNNSQVSDNESLKENKKNTCQVKKSSNQSNPKISFRDNVLLTQSEHDKLLATHGKSAIDWMLDKLSNQKHSTGRKYKSDYHAIMNWVVDAFQNSKSLDSKKLAIDYGKEFEREPDPYLKELTNERKKRQMLTNKI